MKKTQTAREKAVQVDLIDEPKGVIRLEIDAEKIESLSESIKSMGQLQAILIRPIGERFEIVFGHRRYLACKRLSLKTIRATVRVLDDTTAALMRATENVDREDISPVEEAAVYKDLYNNHNLSIDQIAKRMGKSGSIIKRRLDLLKMPPCLQKAVHRKEIPYTVAEELWSLGELSDIEYFLQFAVDHGATKAVVRGWVKDKKDERRRERSAGVQGGLEFAPMEGRPHYVACDTCLQAMEIGQETILRVCKQCGKVIAGAIEKED